MSLGVLEPSDCRSKLRSPHLGQAIVILRNNEGRTNRRSGETHAHSMGCCTKQDHTCASSTAVASRIKMMDSDGWTNISSKYLMGYFYRLWKSLINEQVF